VHELGILFNVVRTVENFARENNVSQIETLVLQVGELSPVVPHYLEACYPAAVDGTLLQETHLKIEVTPAMCFAQDAIRYTASLNKKGAARIAVAVSMKC
jgi:Zn finger protein HypA/HybF involved in hydrogenase expression